MPTRREPNRKTSVQAAAAGSADSALAPPDRSQLPPPATASDGVESFLARVGAESGNLSRQLKAIAQYLEHHRDHIALERVQDVASRCAVQPSAVIRFAKHFGFSGYSEMQKLFRDGVVQRIAPSGSYQARIREVIEHGDGELSSADIADAFVGGAIAGLHELRRDLQDSTLADAVELLAQAPCIWIVGARRAFPVAAYLAYALQHTDKPVHLLTAVGAMLEGELRSLRAGDVLIAVSFAPYASETVLAAQRARDAGARLVALTDSRMSPIATQARATLVVNETSTFGFRSLTNTMALAQGLFVALAYRLELEYGSASATANFRPPAS